MNEFCVTHFLWSYTQRPQFLGTKNESYQWENLQNQRKKKKHEEVNTEKQFFSLYRATKKYFLECNYISG